MGAVLGARKPARARLGGAEGGEAPRLFDQREDPVVLSLVALRLRLLTEEASRHTGKKVGKYTLKELIGAGGMGVAYLAEHDVTLQPAVVKLIHPALATDQDATRRFSEEMKTLGRLQHVGVACIYDGGVHRDPPEQGGSSFPYFAMERMRGVPITVYKQQQTPKLPELLEKFCRACTRHRLRQRAADHSLRPEAAAHPDRWRRPGTRDRLRPRAAARPLAAARRAAVFRGDTRVHEPGAGDRQVREDWSRGRRVRPGHHPLRAARRAATI